MGNTAGSWSGAADWSDLAGVEVRHRPAHCRPRVPAHNRRQLYSHAGDDGSCFDCFENVNLAGDARYSDVVAQLSRQLRAGWRAEHRP